MKPSRKGAFAAAIIVCVVGVAVSSAVVAVNLINANQVTTYFAGSRATIYSDIKGLVADSSIVVRGEVVGFSEDTIPADGGAPGIPTTVAQFRLAEVVEPEGASGEMTFTMPEVGDIVSVVQMGTREVVSEYPILEPGLEYLLFLTASNLHRGEYFVTGVSAGIYVETENGDFRRLVETEDALPERLAIASFQ